MNRTLAALLLLLAAAPMRAGSVAVARHAALATDSPWATRIGLDILRRGGRAIDAAVAAAFALGVVEPQSSGLGGGGFLVYYDASSHAVWSLDFREVAPAAVTRETFSGRVPPRDGAVAAGVPGTVAGLAAMHERFGAMSWKELLEPAVRLAKSEVPVSDALAAASTRAKHDRNLEIPKEKTRSNPDLAATLERIAARGAPDFYRGETASRMVEGVRKAGGLFSHTDLRDYKPLWRAPIRITVHDYDVYAPPPPSSAGLMLAEELNILSGFDLAKDGPESARTVHLVAEAARRAAIDRDHYVGDPADSRTPFADLLSAERGAQWRTSIDPAKVTPTVGLTEPAPPIPEGAHTTHLSVVDSDGNAASLTLTLDDDFGSGFLVPGCGFYLNDAMHEFAAAGGAANAVASGRRMASSASPAVVLRHGVPFLVLGSAGGAAIPNVVLQVFLGVTVFGKSLATAIDAPRFDQQAVPEDLSFEFGRAPASLLEGLRTIGHGLRAVGSIGDVQAVMVDGKRITAVSDPRSGGAAGAY
ncbi:MAG TPA: gamma-glutamyltransferase [Thermoanaerobaculia bacterium]|nr:gamma-glutamyltransferase [Thermoanaerobaculia bacterium]